AHHPTAIKLTLEGLKGSAGNGRVVAVLEPRSHSMRMGVHRDKLISAFADADHVFLYQAPGLKWDINELAGALGRRGTVTPDIEELIKELAGFLRGGDQAVIMSNGGFYNIHERLLAAL
ncbi:MAG: UDP-N-acetylmuramate:L-alanyl-gamma-D-glutamyl-meso-diaminopimelate ligase, partial [Gammaproteobacteria bacterium]|nr:UDP-N-acetylmuramate:L-alanyl-gamma-D-glutamyl-meso-diaminopimelate ligase [Gammaproteobacteria bacterium]